MEKSNGLLVPNLGKIVVGKRTSQENTWKFFGSRLNWILQGFGSLRQSMAFRFIYPLLFVFFFLSPEFGLNGEAVPSFQLSDQFGKKINLSEHPGKGILLMGCLPEDHELCRKIGRKVYWKFQTLGFGLEKEFLCLGYLNLQTKDSLRNRKLAEKLQNPGYESILLDWKGQLAAGTKKGAVYVRGRNRSGKWIIREYWTDVSEEKIKTSFQKIMQK